MILIHEKTYMILNQNRRLAVALLIFIAISFIHFLSFSNYAFKEFCFSVSWVIIPLSIYLYFDSFRVLLPPFIIFLWLFNAIYAVPELITGRQEIGIAANRNWHAALIIGTTPLLLFYLYRFLKKHSPLHKCIPASGTLALPFILALLILYKCYSRAANLALLFVIILFLLMLLVIHKPKNYKRIILFSFLAISLFVTLAILLYGDKIAYSITRDLRLPLWKAGIDLFQDNSLIGVGAPGYESHYSYYMPIDRFLKSWYYADRSDHPHNHILYIAGSFGIIALTAYLYLWFSPIVICLRKYRTLSAQTKIILFSFIALSLHAMLDLVFFRWPTIYIAFIFQGLLWRESFSVEEEKTNTIKPSPGNYLSPALKYFSYFAAAAVLFQASLITFRNIKGSLYLRAGLIEYEQKNPVMSLYFFDKSQKENHNTTSLYNAGILSLLNFNDPRLAMHYFNMLENHPAKIVAHLNSHIAHALIQENHKNEALEYLTRETQVFPISIIALDNKMRIEKELGKMDRANQTANKLLWVFRIKGIPPKDINKIRQNPEIDNHFNEISTEIR
jgi:O-antigen ligase